MKFRLDVLFKVAPPFTLRLQNTRLDSKLPVLFPQSLLKNASFARNTCRLSSLRRSRAAKRVRRGRTCPQLCNPPAPTHHHHHHLDSRRALLHSATADIFSFCSVQQCQQTASTACLWRLVLSLPVHGYGQSTQSAEGTRSAATLGMWLLLLLWLRSGAL